MILRIDVYVFFYNFKFKGWGEIIFFLVINLSNFFLNRNINFFGDVGFLSLWYILWLKLSLSVLVFVMFLYKFI